MKNNSYRFLLKYLAPFKLQLLGVLIALIFSSSSVLLLGKGLEFLIDSGFGENDAKILDFALKILFIIILCLAISSFTRSSLIYIICEKFIANLRIDLYKKMIHVSPETYETQKTSDILSRLSSDTEILTSLIPNVTSVLLRHMITSIGAFCLLIYTSAKLTMFVLIIIPIAIMPIIIIGRKVKKFAKESQGQISKVGERIEESFNNIKIVQSYNRQNYEILNFTDAVFTALSASRKRIVTRSFLVALVICLVFSAIAFVLWIGGRDVILGRMTAGSLSSFIFYSVLLAGSVASLTEIFGDIQRVMASSDRLMEMFNVNSSISEISNPKIIFLKDNSSPSIVFKNCNFAYPSRKHQMVLSDFSLDIKPSEKVAIVGASGAGKTTIMELLLRFYDVDEGEIEINGISIKELSLESLRNTISVVSQEAAIFSSTIYENIKYGNLNATKQEIEHAAKLANISEFIENLPEKYDSFVGEKGIRLSGGQRQRIAIARAILNDAPILLLDEATSALDSVSEEEVQHALENLMKDKSCIVIAHRLSTIQNVNKIIVLENGKIVEFGSHEELMKKKSYYFTYAKKQFN